MSVKHQAWLATPTVVFALMTVGCTASYRPGLGELMNFTQMRHAKLWFAGQEQNWQLAQYEVDELQEGFDEVVRFHASHKDSPLRSEATCWRVLVQQPGVHGWAVVLWNARELVSSSRWWSAP